ncbi:ATP-binding protein [Microbacterium luteolum]|uniref:histidine kinase n=1 Tax=Microbacterium luteolum TaxID=69367 RepID=A0ABY7XRS4_MICLT|nr:HAMP domain-containing sensor histidine kinase [Microbacterium luteolum]WDM44747.1 HAMP domain-containing histidine kinase [Microbacterium luteolum]
MSATRPTGSTEPNRLKLSVEGFRLTLRTRLALTYAGLLTLAGALMMLIVYVVVGYLPTYAFAVPATTAEPLQTTPTEPLYDTGIAAAETIPGLIVSSRSDVQTLILIIAAILLVLLAGGGTWAGWALAGRMLRPLQEVNAAAHRAARGHLDHRIALAGPKDELTDLADTFDEMLEGLERSFGTYRRFAANASHELRTPLATTRAMLDVALSGADAHERPLLERLRETNERSIDTVESLLDLTEVDAASADHGIVQLEQVATFVLAEVAEEAEAAGVRIDYRLSTTPVSGDASLLRQLLFNLIQNGVRHNEPGGWVRVTTESRPRTGAELRVENSGAFVADADLESLTDPFFRARGRSTASTSKGRGLGLSIVKAITDRHDATLRFAAREEGGLVATVVFPPDDAP